jgi:hypothetical protein
MRCDAPVPPNGTRRGRQRHSEACPGPGRRSTAYITPGQFTAWCGANGHSALPATPETAARIVDLADGGDGRRPLAPIGTLSWSGQLRLLHDLRVSGDLAVCRPAAGGASAYRCSAWARRTLPSASAATRTNSLEPTLCAALPFPRRRSRRPVRKMLTTGPGGCPNTGDGARHSDDPQGHHHRPPRCRSRGPPVRRRLRRSELSGLDWHQAGDGDGYLALSAEAVEIILRPDGGGDGPGAAS